MRKRGYMGRKVAAAVTLGVALFAVSAGGASAATTLPNIVDGKADAVTLRIKLTTPIALPGLGSTIEQVISATNGVAHRTASLTGLAKGTANVGSGLLDLGNATSSCPSTTCGNAQKSTGVTLDLPAGLGTVTALGGTSTTSSLINTDNVTDLVKVNMTLVPLIGPGGPLAAVGEAISKLTDTLNAQVVPAVNDVINQVNQGVTQPLLDALKQTPLAPLAEAVKVGPLDNIPDLTKVDLLSLVLKESQAAVQPTTFKGRDAMTAVSSSEIADLSVLGRWVSASAAKLRAVATANGVAGGAAADAVSDIVNLNVGGLLGLKITPDTLNGLTQQVKDTLGPLADVVEILQNTLGVHIDTFGTKKFASPDGLVATASAGTVRITVEPKIPDLGSLAGSGLDASKVTYQSVGLKLTVDLPAAESAIALGDVKGELPFTRPPRTGVATYGIAGLLMIGAAIMVRRFALR